jgi:hypothetical protein
MWKDGPYGHGKNIIVLFAIKPGNPALGLVEIRSIKKLQWWIRCLTSYSKSTMTIKRNGINGTDDY